MARKILFVFSALLCFSAAWALLHGGRQVPLPVVATLPDFRLTESRGTKVTRAALKGQVWIADFIFTSCAGMCPEMTAKMKELQNHLTGVSGVKLVSISVDPARDTPEVLSRYADTYGADRDRWFFLTGEKDDIRGLAQKGFLLAVEEGSGTEPILHSQKFVLVDQEGRIRGYYDSQSQEARKQLLADVYRLL